MASVRLQAALEPRLAALQGALETPQVRHTETILGALCEWLVKQRYLDSNPFDGLPPLPNREEHNVPSSSR